MHAELGAPHLEYTVRKACSMLTEADTMAELRVPAPRTTNECLPHMHDLKMPGVPSL